MFAQCGYVLPSKVRMIRISGESEQCWHVLSSAAASGLIRVSGLIRKSGVHTTLVF